MTHAELVIRAVRWLRAHHRCATVFSEMTGSMESPDAIGWHVGFSRVVECKVSRADLTSAIRRHELGSRYDRATGRWEAMLAREARERLEVA